ncbi:uncharacterized protein LOC118199311 [Stegodyphus dumicola]|uniref:uncharacterized protein LOC118199311 n=1 Tax=Stegodyphus dumicola TaxID=202533 RepID=UPI0015B03648|nr:uncharacterized protein LOC118199311 [Stegodyphus dumicola]
MAEPWTQPMKTVSSSPSKGADVAGETTGQRCESSQIQSSPDQSSLIVSTETKTVLLSTAIVYIGHTGNCARPVIAVLDSASQTNFITSSCANALGLPKQRTYTPISGINETIINIKSKINAKISNKEHTSEWNLDFFIVPKITYITPSRPLMISNSVIPKNIKLDDPQFFKLGIVSPKQYCYLTTSLESLNETMKQFWEVESIEDYQPPPSKELQYCEEHYAKTHSRKSDGRYIVKMPVKTDEENIALGSSKEIASKLLDHLWNRLERQTQVKKLYTEFMREYEQLNHMMEIETETEAAYYLPHHGVYKPEKSSTKLRVFFNASCKTTNGIK